MESAVSDKQVFPVPWCHDDIPTVKQAYSGSANRHEDALFTRLLCKMLITPALLFHFGLVNDHKCNICRSLTLTPWNIFFSLVISAVFIAIHAETILC